MRSFLILIVYLQSIVIGCFPEPKVKRAIQLVNKTFEDGPSKEILDAVQSDDMQKVIYLLDQGTNVNIKDKNGWSPLFVATRARHENMMKTLLSKGAEVNVKDNEGVSPLHLAVINRHEGAVRLLIANGADLNAENIYGWMPLHKTAQQGSLEIAQILIESGAYKNAKLPNGLTAAQLASDNGYGDVVKLLNRDHTQDQVSAIFPETGKPLRSSEQACEVYMKLTGNNILSAGSVAAKEGEFPWMAALGFLIYEKSKYVVSFECGGTIISDYFVMTAAHCVPKTRAPAIVRLGKVSLLEDDGEEPENRDIREIIRHPEYSVKTKKNDIALIRVSRRIYFNTFVAPACLQTDVGDERADVKLIVTGWGYTDAKRWSPSNILRKAQLMSMPWAECNAKLLEYNRKATDEALQDGLSKGQYCTYDPQKKSDSCHGDSGGPVQYFHNTHVATVIGVISYGFGCGNELPSVNTRVAYYLDWIESLVWPKGFTLPEFI